MQDNKRKENEKINEITYNKATEINYYMAYVHDLFNCK